MSICWYCQWGWPKAIAEIYLRARRDIDDALAAGEENWQGEPDCGETAMDFGPAHVVWSDENFDSTDWCLEHCDAPQFKDWNKEALKIVRRSLRELASLPLAIRLPPEGFSEDDDRPELYPPEMPVCKIGEGAKVLNEARPEWSIDEIKLMVCRDFMLENWRPEEDDPSTLYFVNGDDRDWMKLPFWGPENPRFARFTAKQLDIIEAFFGGWPTATSRVCDYYGPFSRINLHNYPYPISFQPTSSIPSRRAARTAGPPT